MNIPHCQISATRKGCEWRLSGEDEIACLSQTKIAGTYGPGKIIYNEGDEADGIFCMMFGTVLVLKMTETGNKILIRIVKSGEMFGYRSFFAGETHSTSCKAIIESKICFIPKYHMHNLLSHHPELGLIFLHQAARNTREENDFCLRIATGSVRMRLIHFLSKFSEANSSYSEEGLVINIPIYRKNIAAMIGVRPESLSRLIYQMENEGIAEFGNKWVRISNPHTFFAGYPFHSPGLGCYAGGMEDASHPVAGVDYPQTFQAMDERFRNDKACRDYIWRLRWPNGFVCRHCGAAVEPWTMARGRLRCRACRGETSLTSGTIFEGTRKPLRMWLMAMWFVTAQRNGVSALGLQRVLGLGSYETAWTWLHKLRRAMVRPGRDLLSGAVEVGKIYVGGPEEGDRGRETEHKAIVAVAAEKNGRGTGRIRLRRIGDVSVDSMFPFIRSAVMPGAVVHTDGWKGYAGLAEAGYQHQVAVINGGSDPAHEVMPRVHIVASLLKQWLIGPHQGGIQRQHLDYYLDEFTFRFNRRRSRSRGLLFHRLSQQAVAIEPAPYRAIINPVGSDGFPLAGE